MLHLKTLISSMQETRGRLSPMEQGRAFTEHSSSVHSFLLMWLPLQNYSFQENWGTGRGHMQGRYITHTLMKANLSHKGVSAWIKCKIYLLALFPTFDQKHCFKWSEFCFFFFFFWSAPHSQCLISLSPEQIEKDEADVLITNLPFQVSLCNNLAERMLPAHPRPTNTDFEV